MIKKEGDYPMRSTKKRLYGGDQQVKSLKMEFVKNLRDEMSLSAAKL